MISLYSGTPGSGKSLHVAEKIYTRLQKGVDCIANFDFNYENIPFRKGDFVFVENWNLTIDYLKHYSFNHAKKDYKGKIKEGQFLLIIDECQMMFNSRDYSKKDRQEWCYFFTQHRKYGFDVILVAQFDRMIDRQIRSLIEYEFIHRKVSNFGWRGWLLNLLFVGNMFACKEMWYPMKEKVSSEFFRFNKKYAKCYDSYKLFALEDNKTSARGCPESNGDKGDPGDEGDTWDDDFIILLDECEMI